MTVPPPITDRQREIISPPPRLKISEWAERYAYVPKEGNAEPGKYHLRRMPWQRAMLDDACDPNVQEIFWEMASQYSGKTLCLTFITEYRVEQQKASTIVIYPTIKSVKRWMGKKLQKTLDATPCMEGLVGNPRKRDDNSTALEREFPGGALTGLGANSTSDFRGTTADGVLQDEIDDYADDGDEGDPCALGDRAAETFSNPLKLKVSTPTLAGFSRIDAGFLSGDQQRYFVPCPCCGHMQWLKTEQMKFSFTEEEHKNLLNGHPNNFKWSIGEYKIQDIERTIYVCESCFAGWTDHQRIKAIMSGHEDNPAVIIGDTKFGVPETGGPLRAEWRATAPFTGIRSRHLSGMYAVIGLKQKFASFLHMFADKFLKSKRGGRAKFQVWVNTFKTEPFQDEEEKVDWKELFDRREEYGPQLPDPVMLVVGMVDNQKDRVEITSMGWGPEQEGWILDHKVIYGDLDMPEMRERVGEHLVNKRFAHRILGELPYRMLVFDSGYQKSPKVKAVYRFCKEHASRDFFAIRGAPNMEGSVYTARIERAFQIRVFNFNVDYLKSIVIGHLQNKIKAGKDATHPNSIHFPIHKDFDEKYFVGVCSERKVTVKLPNGGHKTFWKKVTSAVRNEPWDLIVYGFGAYEILRKAGEVERIERKWLEVKKKIEILDPTSPSLMRVAVEANEPENTVEPVNQYKPPNPFKKVQGPAWAGKWNKLGIR